MSLRRLIRIAALAALAAASVPAVAGPLTMAGPKCFGCATGGGGSDTTPDAFSFTDQTGVATSTTITSAAVSITGIDTAITCSATGGTVDKNSSGSFASSQSVANNDTIRARHTSSASNSTTTNTAVDCNGVSDTFSSTTVAGGGAFVYPIGIPTVPAGLEPDIDLPTLPSPWSSNQANYYYVCSGGGNGGNGYPASPRSSLPSPVPAGAVVVLCNTANLTVSNYTLTINGSSGSKAWIVGSQRYGLGSGSALAQVRQSTNAQMTGTWAVIDGVDFYTTGTSSDYWAFANPKNFLLRNSYFRGDGQARSNNNAHYLGGSGTSNRASNIVFYSVEFRDTGLWTYDSGSDTDVHCLQLGQWIDGLWALDSKFYHCQGDGIQATWAGGTGITDARNLYFGRNEFYENLQTGLWFKFGSSIVVSQNTFWGFTNGGGSAPVATGGQYDFGTENGAWWIANKIYDSGNGIVFQSDQNGASGQKLRLIGNQISNIVAASGVQNASPWSDGSPISVRQGRSGQTIVIAFNSIWKFNGQGIGVLQFPGMKIENNIIQGRTNANSCDIMVEVQTGTPPTIRNNQFPASLRVAVDQTSPNYTTASGLNSGGSGRHTNNRGSSTTFTNAVDGSSADLSLQSGDGAINAGTLTTDVFDEFQTAFGIDIRKDFLGVVRPQGGAYDIGAYEQ